MIKRIWNLIKGVINSYIYEFEKARPEIVYDNAIEQLSITYKRIKENAAKVIRRADELEEKVKSTQLELNQAADLLAGAAALPEDKVDYEAAAELLKMRDEHVIKLNGLLEDLKSAQEDEKSITESLRGLESKKRALIAEKDREVGRFESAKAKLDMMEREDGTSLDAINKALTGVRSAIKNTIAEANLTKQLQDNTLEAKLKSFSTLTQSASSMEKFKLLRQQTQEKLNKELTEAKTA